MRTKKTKQKIFNHCLTWTFFVRYTFRWCIFWWIYRRSTVHRRSTNLRCWTFCLPTIKRFRFHQKHYFREWFRFFGQNISTTHLLQDNANCRNKAIVALAGVETFPVMEMLFAYFAVTPFSVCLGLWNFCTYLIYVM